MGKIISAEVVSSVIGVSIWVGWAEDLNMASDHDLAETC